MMGSKQFIKTNFPSIYSIFKKTAVAAASTKTHEKIFEEKYSRNLWKSKETVSGPGSTEKSTENLISSLRLLLAELNVKSILDAGCGDFSWMKNIISDEIDYTGIDVVDELIKINLQKYQAPNIRFIKKDIASERLPGADLIICRDVLVHYSINDIKQTLRNFVKSGSQYVLTTSFEECRNNEEIFTGGWRSLNLEIEPFNLPAPQRRIYEMMDKEGKYFPDKHLALWKLQEIKI
jgi:SAM-dependent methyltransferase